MLGVESEFADFESESEWAEARGPVRKPSTQSSFKPRTPPTAAANYVTQAQLEASFARADGKIKVLSDGVSTVNSKITALAAASKKEAEERKKTLDAQSKDLNQKIQMMALLPMLIQAPTASGPQITIPAIPAGGAAAQVVKVTDSNNVPIDTVAKPDNSTMDMLLPLLMVTGLGSGSGGLGFGGDGGADGGSSMMMLALVLAMSRK